MPININSIADAIIAHAAANQSMRYTYAIRTDDARKTVGSICRLSRDWNHDLDRPSSKRLPGTCGTKIDIDVDIWTDYEDVVKAVDIAMQGNSVYFGAHKYIIAGNANYAMDGEDDDEVILSVDERRTYRDGAMRGAQVVYIAA